MPQAMPLADVLTNAINPALALLPATMTSDGARVMLLAIGLQESGFNTRHQYGGPARGFWQFEINGVRGVLTHKATREIAMAICAARQVEPLSAVVYEALGRDDVLAAAFARFLLWTDEAAIPPIGDAQASWAMYLRNWRPGMPRRNDWSANYDKAMRAVQ